MNLAKSSLSYWIEALICACSRSLWFKLARNVVGCGWLLCQDPWGNTWQQRWRGCLATALIPGEGLQQGVDGMLPHTPTHSRLGGEQQGDPAFVSLLGLT